MKYYCATEVEYLKTIVNPLGRKPTVYTRTRRNNTPITAIRRNLLSNVQEPVEIPIPPDISNNFKTDLTVVIEDGFSKEEALELALEVKNRKFCWNCTFCVMIEIREEQE